jgi:hypothetical protein
LLLHVLEERPFQDVARALRLTQAGVYRAYRRALDQLRLRAGLELDPDDVLASRSGRQSSIERLVTVLHEATRIRGRLPGRATVCARANISEVRFARLMGLLVTRGCIVGRSARKPGRLAHHTVEETLAHLRRQQDAALHRRCRRDVLDHRYRRQSESNPIIPDQDQLEPLTPDDADALAPDDVDV